MIKLPTEEEFKQILRESDDRVRKQLAAKGVDYDSLPVMSEDELNSPEVQKTISEAIDKAVSEELGEEFDAAVEAFGESEEYKAMMEYIFEPGISLEESHKRLCEYYPDCATM